MKIFSELKASIKESIKENTCKIVTDISDLTNCLKNKVDGTENFVSFQDIQNTFTCKFPLKTDEEFLIFNNNLQKNIADIKTKLVSIIFFIFQCHLS